MRSMLHLESYPNYVRSASTRAKKPHENLRNVAAAGAIGDTTAQSHVARIAA